MQHYGCPTRLLDFTHCFGIAAFFALEETPDEGASESAIWAIKYAGIEFMGAGRGKSRSIKLEDATLPEFNSCASMASGYLSAGYDRLLLPGLGRFEAKRMDTRMSAQQSTFLLPMATEMSFFDNLKTQFKIGSHLPQKKTFRELQKQWLSAPNVQLAKLTMPSSLRPEFLCKLDSIMNINALTLFPGLDGLGRSLKKHVFKTQEEVTTPQSEVSPEK